MIFIASFHVLQCAQWSAAACGCIDMCCLCVCVCVDTACVRDNGRDGNYYYILLSVNCWLIITLFHYYSIERAKISDNVNGECLKTKIINLYLEK